MTTIPLLVASKGPGEIEREWCWGETPELCLYRRRTVSILRRYSRLSMEAGRLPSLLGREFFRSRVTSYHMYTFEDIVIFERDVERCLEQLDSLSRDVIARVALEEYTQEECAWLLGCTRRTIGRIYQEALDHLSDMFLSLRIMEALPPAAEEQDFPETPEPPTEVDASARISREN